MNENNNTTVFEASSDKEGFEVTGSHKFWNNMLKAMYDAHQKGQNYIVIETTIDHPSGNGKRLRFSIEAALVDAEIIE